MTKRKSRARKGTKTMRKESVKKLLEQESQLSSPLADLQCNKETESLLVHIVAYMPLEIIDFNCEEVLDGSYSPVGELLLDTPADQLLNDYDLTLLNN